MADQEDNATVISGSAPLVSIIIPVYNTPVEHFSRMLDSVVGQTYRNLEIIVVDDGSEEENARAYEEICADDDRITVLHKENGGVSSARNLGIDNSRGTYLMFVDADDALVDICVDSAVQYALEYDLDIVSGGIERYYSDVVTYSKPHFDEEICLVEGQDTEHLANFFFAHEKIHEKPWITGTQRAPVAKLYRRSTIGDLRFPENLDIYEDIMFNYLVTKNSRTVGLVNAHWYRYYRNAYSAMGSFRLDAYIGRHMQALEMFVVDDKTARNFYVHLCYFLLDALEHEVTRGEKGTISRFRKWLNHPKFQEAFQNIDQEYFSFGIKRRIVYWFCRHRFALPVYLLYSMRGGSRRRKGQTSM